MAQPARIAIIPARGGSKGIPRKNLALLGDKPLLQWTAEAALSSGLFEAVLLSTDDEEIAAYGRSIGLMCKQLRPENLAQDATPMMPVIRHEIDLYEKLERSKPSSITLLQPTSPFRTSVHLREAAEKFETSGADALVSIVAVPHQFHPDSVLKVTTSGEVIRYNDTAPIILRRQDKPAVFARNGPAILMMKRTVLQSDSFYSGRTVSYLMSAEESVDIDHGLDLKFAEFLLKKDKRQ